MLPSSEFALEDRDDIAPLVRHHPGALVGSAVDGVPGISHAPVLLDGAQDGEVHDHPYHAAAMRRHRPGRAGERT